MDTSNGSKAEHLRKLLFKAEQLEESGDLINGQVSMSLKLQRKERIGPTPCLRKGCTFCMGHSKAKKHFLAMHRGLGWSFHCSWLLNARVTKPPCTTHTGCGSRLSLLCKGFRTDQNWWLRGATEIQLKI